MKQDELVKKYRRLKEQLADVEKKLIVIDANKERLIGELQKRIKCSDDITLEELKRLIDSKEEDLKTRILKIEDMFYKFEEVIKDV